MEAQGPTGTKRLARWRKNLIAFCVWHSEQGTSREVLEDRVTGPGRPMKRRRNVRILHRSLQDELELYRSRGDRLKAFGQVMRKPINRGRRLQHMFVLFVSDARVGTCTDD